MAYLDAALRSYPNTCWIKAERVLSMAAESVMNARLCLERQTVASASEELS